MTQVERPDERRAVRADRHPNKTRLIVGEILGVETDTDRFYLKHLAVSAPRIDDWVRIRPVTTSLHELRYVGPDWTRYQNDDGFMEACIVDVAETPTSDDTWDKRFIFSP